MAAAATAASENIMAIKKLLNEGKTLFSKDKFVDAGRKFDAASRLTKMSRKKNNDVGNNDDDDDDYYGDNPESVETELHVCLAECFLGEADQIRSRGSSVLSGDLRCQDDDDDDNDDYDYSTDVGGKRRKMTNVASSSSIDAQIMKHKQLLQDALKEVNEGLRCSNADDRSSLMRRLLFLGAEIMLKLSFLGPVISPPSEVNALRDQAFAMVTKFKRSDRVSDRDDDDNDDFDGPLVHREWRVLMLLGHGLYVRRIENHPASSLIRNRSRTFFVVTERRRRSNEEAEERGGGGCSSDYAFSSLNAALDFVLPDFFHESLDPNYLEQTVTFVLLPPTTEAAEQQRAEEVDDSRDHNLHSSSHVCFFLQRFYRLESQREKDFLVQLVFCDLCAAATTTAAADAASDDVNVDAVFYLRGFIPKQLDASTDAESRMSQLEFQSEVNFTDEISTRKKGESNDEDFGFHQLSLNDDKVVFETLFPSIREVFCN